LAPVQFYGWQIKKYESVLELFYTFRNLLTSFTPYVVLHNLVTGYYHKHSAIFQHQLHTREL